MLISTNATSEFCYIDDVLSLNNSGFGDYLHLIYPNELEVKDIADLRIDVEQCSYHCCN
jgi:hypothetical protein